MELAIFLFFVIILAGAVLSLICVAKLPILLYHESNGERCLLSALRNLPGNPYFFRNLYLPTVTGRTTEIDLVMVHESGIYFLSPRISLVGFSDLNLINIGRKHCLVNGMRTRHAFSIRFSKTPHISAIFAGY